MELEKTLDSPLDSKEIKPVNPKGNQPWIFTGRTDAEAEVPILCPPDAKSQLIGKDPEAGQDWRWEEKGDDRGWDGWMASSIQWTWVWANFWRWWRTEKSSVLQSMGSQRAGHDLVSEHDNTTTMKHSVGGSKSWGQPPFKGWGQEEKGTAEKEIVGWHHRFNGHEFKQTQGDSERQGSLAHCSSWGHRVRHDWVIELN